MPEFSTPPHRRATLIAVLAAVVVLVLGIAGIAISHSGGEVAGKASPAVATSDDTATKQRPSPTERQRGHEVTRDRCTQAELIAEMPLRDRLAQLLMVGVGASSDEQALSVMRSEQVGGIFLTGDATGLLTGGALKRVQDASPIPLMVSVDDEGGRVERVAALEGEMPSARGMAATMTPDEVYRLALRRGHALADRGVTMNLAPSVDVSSQPDGAVIGDRSFGAEPATVARYAGAFARGLRDAGVMPVYKHFPGHGRATGNSHAGAVTTPPLSELTGNDLRPYRQLLGRGKAAVMLGHLNVPGLTERGVPASLSPSTVTLLRERFGFNGLIVTDDLYAMDAIRERYSVPEAARMALAAGADMALMISSSQLDAVLDHLESSVTNGTLPEQRVNDAVGRVLHAKGVELCDGK